MCGGLVRKWWEGLTLGSVFYSHVFFNFQTCAWWFYYPGRLCYVEFRIKHISCFRLSFFFVQAKMCGRV